MIKNIKRFLKESENKRKKFLKKLTKNKAAEILGNLISSNILNKLISRPKAHPVSIEKMLRHAKLSR
jgi:hypothetical protein